LNVQKIDWEKSMTINTKTICACITLILIIETLCYEMLNCYFCKTLKTNTSKTREVYPDD